MKNLKTTIMSALLMVLISIPAIAQNREKVIAVVNKADWCSTCEKHGDRAIAAFKEANRDGNFLLVVNDVTSDETKAKSAAMLKKAGLDKDAMDNLKATGVTYFFNAETKELISKVSVSKKDEVLVEAMHKALMQ